MLKSLYVLFTVCTHRGIPGIYLILIALLESPGIILEREIHLNILKTSAHQARSFDVTNNMSKQVMTLYGTALKAGIPNMMSLYLVFFSSE